MQNAIRKGDYEIAGYALWELLPQYTPYLRKRLLVISAEDCYGVITKEILALTEYGGEEELMKALALLCMCKKNRDADYFVCNLMTTDNLTGGSKDELGKALSSAIRTMDVVKAGELCAELFKKNRKHLWKVLTEMTMVFHPHLEDEVNALCRANEAMSKPSEETIFVAKAIVLMWTKRDAKDDLLGIRGMHFDHALNRDAIKLLKRVEDCCRFDGLFPDWAYNWHTTYGKYKLKRDAVHAIDNDQWLLTPREENLFDDCTWNRDLNACLAKHNPNGYRLPYDDGKRKPEEKYGKKD